MTTKPAGNMLKEFLRKLICPGFTDSGFCGCQTILEESAMAQIVFLREGVGSDRVASACDLPVDSVLIGVGARQPKFIGAQLPTLRTERPDLTAFRDPTYVAVHIPPNEIKGMFDRSGYYLLIDVTPTEASRWK